MIEYLAQRGELMSNELSLMIPNREIPNICAEQILIIFKKQVSKNGAALETFYTFLAAGNPQKVEQQFTAELRR